jgi:predicted TPR repeat methyltransferase
LVTLYDFGNAPLAGYFPKPGEASEAYRIPMQLKKCLDCELVQVSPCVYDEDLFNDYRYLSRFAMSSHFEELSDWILTKLKISNSRVLEIGCNDGTLLTKLQIRGMRVEGVDPASNIASYAIAQGHKVYCEYFSDTFVEKYELENEYDLLVSCNSFAHISNIRGVSNGVSLALKDRGFFIVEVQAWPELVKSATFDFVYHEHRYYYDLRSISNLLKQFNLYLIESTLVDSHGKSYRLIFQKNCGEEESVSVLRGEKILTIEQIKSGVDKFLGAIKVTRDRLDALEFENRRVIAFGASGRGNMILAQFNRTDDILAVFDESPERVNREMGLTGIPIKDFKEIKESDYDVCLILAWNHATGIIAKWPHRGKLLLVPLPQLYEYRT